MELRLLLAMVLMLGVLAVTPYFYKTPPPPTAKQAAKTVETKPPATAAPQATPATPTAATPPPTAPPAPGAVAANAEEKLAPIETDLYRIEFTNRGAAVKSWILKKYKDSNGKPLDLVSPAGVKKAGYPMAVSPKNLALSTDLTQALYTAKPIENGYEFEFSNGRTYSKKTFAFKPGSYLSTVSSDLTENGSPVPHLVVWRGEFGDWTVPNSAPLRKSLYFDTAQNKLVENDQKFAESGPQTRAGNFAFAGLEDAYFAMVALQQEGGAIELLTFNTWIPGSDGKEVPVVGAGIGGEASNRLTLFTGPKDYNLLKSVDPRLEGMIDFGWTSIIAKPLFLALKYTNDNWVKNWGWSIILVTVIINVLLLPLKISSLKSMRKMALVQPEMQAINDKYKGLSMKDPKMANKNQEVMDLYKKHGVNPAGGCLPLLLQMPFLFAFYAVLSVAIEIRQANWLWVTDLAQPETIAIRVLPLIMIATQFWMQKMTPATGGDPAQQKMMLFMPLIFGFMFYGASSGLVLYWLTGNVVGIVQQWAFNKTMPAPAPAVSPAKPAPKKKSGK
ncbi:MAG: membrane protein insertase YidC [Bryobacteraceae bacterium]|nr:membrane protein insertase YidC [Bryobacteraceae bacterium]